MRDWQYLAIVITIVVIGTAAMVTALIPFVDQNQRDWRALKDSECSQQFGQDYYWAGSGWETFCTNENGDVKYTRKNQ